MLLGRGCISPCDLPTPAQGSFFCYLSLPSVHEAGMPWGAECFCLLMAYLKGPERKKKQKNIWCVPSHPSNWQIFLDEREEPAQGSMVHHSLGHGAEGLLALKVSSPKASSTLCMAEEDQRREQNSLNSTVVPQRSPAHRSN